jgi:elongation factor Ts
MAEITASMVKELREKTGAGMMDCKTALSESKGNLEAAVDWLRAKGLSKAAKKASRIAAEGLIGLVTESTAGAVVEVNSETDFVARNDRFQSMVREIARLALKAQVSVEKLKSTQFPGAKHTVAEHIADMVATIGENMSLRRTDQLRVSTGVVGSYVHNQVKPGLGKIGVLVAIESEGKPEELANVGRMLAMHIAAANPVALDLAGVPLATLDREKAILSEKNAGKPAHVLEKIIQSGLKSYAKEACLLEQAYVHDPSKTVAQALREAEGRAGASIKITGFVRYQLGEGIERQAADFASEVAKAAGAA